MTLKNTLIWTSSVIGAGAVMALVFGALERTAIPRTISVSGECLTTVPRDKTAITLRVTTLDKNAAASMRTATAQVSEITDFLKTQNVEMQTTEFNSYEKNEWNRDAQKNEVLGIETSIAIQVSAPNIETIEKILSQFAGQTNVYSENLRMYSSPAVMTSAMEKCLAAAVENARVRADALASGDGRRAGKMLSVSYNANTSNNYQPIMPRMMTKMAVAESAAMDASGTLVSRDTDVSVTVSAVFEIR